MNKYELAENLTKLANELFKEETHIVNIEEGIIDKPEKVLFDKAASFEPKEEEFNEIYCSMLISQFIKLKVVPEIETLLLEDMLEYKRLKRFFDDEKGIVTSKYPKGIIAYESPKELEKSCVNMDREKYLSQFSGYSLLPENRFPNDTNIHSVWISDTVKYIYKIYVKYVPRERNQFSDEEELTFRILIERKVD